MPATKHGVILQTYNFEWDFGNGRQAVPFDPEDNLPPWHKVGYYQWIEEFYDLVRPVFATGSEKDFVDFEGDEATRLDCTITHRYIKLLRQFDFHPDGYWTTKVFITNNTRRVTVLEMDVPVFMADNDSYCREPASFNVKAIGRGDAKYEQEDAIRKACAAWEQGADYEKHVRPYPDKPRVNEWPIDIVSMPELRPLYEQKLSEGRRLSKKEIRRHLCWALRELRNKDYYRTLRQIEKEFAK